MLHRPWSLIAVAFLHLLVGPFLVFLVSQQTRFDIGEYLYRLKEFDPMIYGPLFFYPVFMSIFLYLMKRWSYVVYVLIFAIEILVLSRSYFSSGNVYFDLNLLSLIISHSVLFVYVSFTSARQIYFNPRLRWWESKTRYQVQLPISMIDLTNSILEATLVDYSEGGAFVKTTSKNETGKGFDQSHYTLQMKFEDQELAFSGQIVHRRSPHEAGFQFIYKSWSEKRMAQKIAKAMAKKGLPRRTPPLNRWNSFKSWLADF